MLLTISPLVPNSPEFPETMTATRPRNGDLSRDGIIITPNMIEGAETSRSAAPVAIPTSDAATMRPSRLNPQANAFCAGPCQLAVPDSAARRGEGAPSSQPYSASCGTGHSNSIPEQKQLETDAEWKFYCPEWIGTYGGSPKAESFITNQQGDLQLSGVFPSGAFANPQAAKRCKLPANDISQGIESCQTNDRQIVEEPASLHFAGPGTPPKNNFFSSGGGSPLSLSSSDLSSAISSLSSSFSIIGDTETKMSMANAGNMNHALNVALTDAVVLNKPADLAVMMNTAGLTPDTTVPWYPPDSLAGAPIERSLIALAAYFGSRDVVTHLLAIGADPNLPSPQDGMTALHTAAAGGSSQTVEIIHLLLAQGGDRNALDSLGRMPVEILVQQKPATSSTQTAAPQVNQQLLDPSGQWDDSFEDDGILVGPHVPNPPGCLSLSDINRPEYSTDEFRINFFKVLKCTKSHAHDWTECPFVHPGEKARRRSPSKFNYSSAACPDFRKGVCRRGDACSFSHGVFECWLHPARYRTQMCKDGALCNRRVCFFAHAPSELRAPTGNLSCSPCKTDSTPVSAASVPHPDLHPYSVPPMSFQISNLEASAMAQQLQELKLCQPALLHTRRRSADGVDTSLRSSWTHNRRVMRQSDEAMMLHFMRQQQEVTFAPNSPPRHNLIPEPKSPQPWNVQKVAAPIIATSSSLSCPASPLMSSPLQEQLTMSPKPSCTLNHNLWSPSVKFPYKMAGNGAKQQLRTAPLSPPAAPRVLQLVQESGSEDLPDTPTFSRVGSLSALDVSWVDELAHED